MKSKSRKTIIKLLTWKDPRVKSREVSFLKFSHNEGTAFPNGKFMTSVRNRSFSIDGILVSVSTVVKRNHEHTNSY